MKWEQVKEYIAPRYWFSALGVILILLGLTGGTEIKGYDVTIEGDLYRIISVSLGVMAIVGGLDIYKKFTKKQREIDEALEGVDSVEDMKSQDGDENK